MAGITKSLSMLTYLKFNIESQPLSILPCTTKCHKSVLVIYCYTCPINNILWPNSMKLLQQEKLKSLKSVPLTSL